MPTVACLVWEMDSKPFQQVMLLSPWAGSLCAPKWLNWGGCASRLSQGAPFFIYISNFRTCQHFPPLFSKRNGDSKPKSKFPCKQPRGLGRLDCKSCACQVWWLPHARRHRGHLRGLLPPGWTPMGVDPSPQRCPALMPPSFIWPPQGTWAWATHL